jgi:DNA (cytosine-5)-methyltransferase 3A
MNILSLFDGLSCAQVVINKLGIKNYTYYASEIDKYAIAVTQYNYPNTIQVGDITKLKGKDFKDIDLIIGGSPCQDLSIAKKDRKGLKGSRSILFWEFVRLLKEINPKYFLLENVNSMPKEAKDIITKTLEVEPIMINASLVSAQQRKRLFWTNILNIIQPKDKGILLKDILENKNFYGLYSDYNNSATFDKARTIGAGCGINRSSTFQQVITKPIRIAKIGKGGQGDRIYSVEGKSVSLSASGGGRGAKTGLYLIQGVAKRTINGKKQIELNKLEKANAMTSVQTDSLVAIKDYVRKLTPIECERLQCLSDNYALYGNFDGKIKKISNTQRYKMIGNSFCCDVIVHILKSADF